MNPQQEAIALWRFYESRGFSPSVRSIGRALRDQGLSFTEYALRGWLSGFPTRRRRNADAEPTQETSTNDAIPTQSRRKSDATTRAPHKVSLVSTSEKSNDFSHDPPPKQKALPLGPDSETIRAKAILAAIWPRVAPFVEPTMMRGSWASRNIKAAREMAHLPVEAIVAAHEKHLSRDGTPLYTLAWLHERMLRGDSGASDGVQGAGWGKPRLGPYDTLLDDGTVIYGNEKDPPPLSALIAAGEA